jgi:GT2 family glycosyltransferase/SAM-dependent methyltransferase
MRTGSEALVSVIMIFFDAEEFFEEAIASVLAQTHPSIELLLCDDGSTDGSTAIAREWARNHPAVHYLEHPGHAHRGMSATRNLGIAAARGDLVAFLDADDVWDSSHLDHDVSLLLTHPDAGLVCGQAVDWRSWQDPQAPDRVSLLPWPSGVVVPPPRMLTALLRRGDFRTPTCSLLVRKQALDAIGGAEDEFQNLFEDQALLAKLYLAQSCVISGSRTARYRRHAASSTARAERKGSYHPFRPNLSYERFLRWLSDLPEVRDGVDCAELRSLIRDGLQPYDQVLTRARWRARSLVAAKVSPPARETLRRGVRRARGVGPVRMGSLRRLTPLSRQFGYERGLPVDRYYIERFLAANAHAIGGRVLEVGDSTYTRRFGGTRVTRADVLNIDAGAPETTIVADLACGEEIRSASFDCLVITQTLHLVYDVAAAVRTLHRVLRPGGTVLATVPGISPLSTDRWADTWYWSLTPLSATRLFADVFGPENIEVSASGNVLASVAFLEGIAAEELRRRELESNDPQFPLLITVRAYRPLSDSPVPEDGDGD